MTRQFSTQRPTLVQLLQSAILLVIFTSQVCGDILFQSDSRDSFPDVPFPFFFFEAEYFHDNNPRGAGASWLFSSEEESLLQTVEPEFEPNPGQFASGGESITNAIEQSTVTNNVGGQHDVQYLIQFDTPGSYYLYIRQHSPLGPDNNRNPNDSFYYPIAFGEDPIQNKANGDDYGILESMLGEGDTFQPGPWVWFAARTEVDNLEQNPLTDQRPSTFLEWTITEDMVDENHILEFDHRETGTMLDAFVFIDVNSGIPPTNGLGPDGMGFTGSSDLVDLVFGLSNLGGLACDIDGDGSCVEADINIINGAIQAGSNEARFDVTGDGTVDVSDRDEILRQIGSLPGDANLSGATDASDLNAIGTNWLADHGSPQWGKGDFNGDGRTDASDLNTLGIWWQKTSADFTAQAPAASPVPEPNSGFLLVTSLMCLSGIRRRR